MAQSDGFDFYLSTDVKWLLAISLLAVGYSVEKPNIHDYYCDYEM